MAAPKSYGRHGTASERPGQNGGVVDRRGSRLRAATVAHEKKKQDSETSPFKFGIGAAAVRWWWPIPVPGTWPHRDSPLSIWHAVSTRETRRPFLDSIHDHSIYGCYSQRSCVGRDPPVSRVPSRLTPSTIGYSIVNYETPKGTPEETV